MYLQQLWVLVKKEFLSEWRQKHTVFGVLLYVGCTVFVLYMMVGKPSVQTWNALFWVAQIFIAVNTISRSFLQETEGRMRYFRSLVSPAQLLVSKLIYGLVLMLLMSLIALLLFVILLGNPLYAPWTFVGLTCLGGLSLSLVFTFLSAIAAQAKQNAALMAILGFPLVIPLLLILSKLSLVAISPIAQDGWWELAVSLLFMDVLIIGLSTILFPFLWKE